jgi:hypothetical protein
MPTKERERGAGLILLIGITAALAILTASLTMMIANQQRATAHEKRSKTSMYYTEAAMNSALAALKGTTTWLTAPYTDTTAMNTNYSELPDPKPVVTYRVYDNASVVTSSTPAYDYNLDTKMWIEAQTTYLGRTTRVRRMVASVTQSVVSRFPRAALFSGGAGSNDNIYFKSNGDAYLASYTSWPATNTNAVPYTGGAPFPTSIMSVGNITSTGSANLAVGSNPQSLGVWANGSVSIPGRSPLIYTRGGVPDLATYFSSSDQLKLQQASRDCLDPEVSAVFASAKVDARPTYQRQSFTGTAFASEASLRVTTGNLYGTYSSNIFTANTDLTYSGNLTLGNAGTTYNFRRLKVSGNLTLSGTARVTATSLWVTGTLTISTTSTGGNSLGDDYVVGNTTVGGTSPNQFGAFVTDGSVTLSGTGTGTGATFSSLYAGSTGSTLTLSSNTAPNQLGNAYVKGAVSSTSAKTSPNTFSSLWTDNNLTLNSSGAMTTNSLHVGGAMSINSPVITNAFGSAWVVGNLSTTSSSTSTNNFLALWVDGALTLSGATTTHAKATHVAGDFTIDGPTSINQFGPIYCAGDVDWAGLASVQTLDYTNADLAQAAQPMWIGGTLTREGGSFNDVYGNSFVVFRVNFTPTSGHSTVMCPLLATTEMITTSGDVDFGTMVTDGIHTMPRPMTLYMVCDNDGLYTQTGNWGSTGQFYGLMVFMEAGIKITTGNVSKPAVVGSVMSIGGDYGVTVDGNAQVAYCQDVIDAVSGTLVTTSTTTQAVPGTWQELSPNEP